MRTTRFIPAALAAAALAAPGAALAAEAGGEITDVEFSYEGPFGTFDKYQLQRGFQVYHEVCAGCHGLKYVAFRTLGDETGPAFPPDQVKAIAAQYDVPDGEGEPGDTRPGRPSDRFPEVTALGAPDLSLMGKARAGFHGPYSLGINQLLEGQGGPEYIYSLLTGYTGEEVEMAGAILYKNDVFPGGNIAMAPPLSEGIVEYETYGGGEGEGEAHAGGYHAPEPTVEQMSKDVSAFLMWAAEPHMTERKQAGFRNVLFLIVLTVLLYFTNKTLWAKVKRKDTAENQG